MANLSCSVKVVGKVLPYSFENESTGEVVGLVHLQVPGAIVSADVPPDEAKKMTPGDVWEFVGLCVVRAGKGRIHINELQAARCVEKRNTGAGVVFHHAPEPDSAPSRSAKAG